MNIIEFTTEAPNHKIYTVSVSGDSPNSLSFDGVSLVYSVVGPTNVAVNLDVQFSANDGSLHITGFNQEDLLSDAFLQCLVLCGLKHLVDEILDCWKRGNRTPQKLWDCLKSKGAKIGLGMAGCAVKCALDA